jgi:hypothetical protein
MLPSAKEDIETALAQLKNEVREMDGKLSGRYNGLGNLRSVARRIMLSAERIEQLVVEAESKPKEALNPRTQMVY